MLSIVAGCDMSAVTLPMSAMKRTCKVQVFPFYSEVVD